MKKPSKYNASLQAASSMPDIKREIAETRYVELLELAFGSSSRVRGAYVEYVAVLSLRAENPWDPVSPEEQQVLTRWEQVSGEASRAVLAEMKITGDAFFELRVWNSRTT